MTGGGKTLRFHVIFTFTLTSTSASVRADEFSESIFDLLINHHYRKSKQKNGNRSLLSMHELRIGFA